MQGSQEAEDHARGRATVALVHDELVRPRQLRETLELHGCHVTDIFPNATNEELRELQRHVDLLVIPVDSGRPEMLSRLKDLSSAGDGAKIFALARPQDIADCLEALRGSGSAGLLATNASASHVEFRLNEILGLFPERRRCERVPIMMPVEVVSADGARSWEYGISLSVAGIGIASRRALPTNTDLSLRLKLAYACDPVSLRGRVIHCLQESASIPPFRVGVYFIDTGHRTRRQLEAVVATAI